jgi:hypothetical protein
MTDKQRRGEDPLNREGEEIPGDKGDRKSTGKPREGSWMKRRVENRPWGEEY